ncbi:hypothetical protein B0H14DRAFT_3631930 [Mycena olivaceomarginata]|nr:hypothetical protein B0H14DRAFT_3631930 [Mycena olivaceomarginata]
MFPALVHPRVRGYCVKPGRIGAARTASDGGSYSERGRSCSFTLKYFGYIYLIGCMCGVWKPGQRLGARSLMLSVLLYACQDKKMRNFTCDIPAIAAEDCPQFWRPQDVSDVSSGGFTRAKAQGRPSASDQAIKLINRLQTTENLKHSQTLITNNFNGGFKTDHIAFVSISAALDETSDAMLRDINLSQSHAATRTETYLAELLYKMETIKFATEWQKQTGPGALASKAKYNTELFQRENIAIFRDLSNWQKKTKWKSIPLNSATLKSLANNLLPLVIGCCLPSTIFGTGVLIHPFFATHNLGHKRAHHFKSLLDVFINLTPPAENSDVQGAKRFDDLEETNREVLYTLVSALCSSDEEEEKLAAHIDDFYIRIPPRFQLSTRNLNCGGLVGISCPQHSHTSINRAAIGKNRTRPRVALNMAASDLNWDGRQDAPDEIPTSLIPGIPTYP